MITWNTAVLFHRQGDMAPAAIVMSFGSGQIAAQIASDEAGRWVEKSHQSCMLDVGIFPQHVRLPEATWRGSGDHDVLFGKTRWVEQEMITPPEN